MRDVTIDSAAAGRSRRSRGPRRSPTGVTEPSKGTALAVGFPLLATVVVLSWIAIHGLTIDVGAVPFVGLLVATACAERVTIQLGPRSWYSPSSAVLVVVGLLAGPVAGYAAGAVTAVAVAGKPIRRRGAEAGICSLQGLVAGFV